ncbi:MAG: 2Fe-2S iron-sulfur cluster-binding protein, partial [Ktedonobacterales bacterium]
MAEQEDLVNLTIDGRPVSVPKGSVIWAAAQKLGIEIPIYCYHPKM